MRWGRDIILGLGIFLGGLLVSCGIINVLLKRTGWYRRCFGDILKFRDIPYGLDVINLGSNSGKYGFDYGGQAIRGANLAVGPQTLEFDKKVFEAYGDRVEKGGTVFIPVTQFVSILSRYEHRNANDKYTIILPRQKLSQVSCGARGRLKFHMVLPVLKSWDAAKYFLRGWLKRDNLWGRDAETNPMGEAELRKDAERWIEGWKRQFSIKELADPFSERHSAAFEKNVEILSEIISSCFAKELIPVLVLIPMTVHLRRYFSPEIKKKYVDDFIGRVRSLFDVKLLDYTLDEALSRDELYFNSFFLNQRGRKIFTRRALVDAGVIVGSLKAIEFDEGIKTER